MVALSMMVYELELFGVTWEKLPRSYFRKNEGTELFAGHNDVVDFISEKFDLYLSESYGALAVYRVGVEVVGPKMTIANWKALKEQYPEMYSRVTKDTFSFWKEFLAEFGEDFQSDVLAWKKLKQTLKKQGEGE